MPEASVAMRPPEISFADKLKQRLFGSLTDTIITVVCSALLIYLVVNAIDWIFLSSIWAAEDEPLCREATGACWSVIDARHRIIFFGLFPYDDSIGWFTSFARSLW